jgi:hypothetical protein
MQKRLVLQCFPTFPAYSRQVSDGLKRPMLYQLSYPVETSVFSAISCNFARCRKKALDTRFDT